jgi:(p)ppGpp synthase/HD superfamily hydrolase
VHDVARGVRELGLTHEIVAVLHDTVEDTDLPLAKIRKRFGDEVADAVDAMTKRDGEDFFRDYMPRVLASPVARAVKLSDATANRRKAVLLNDPAERARYVAKYDRAIRMIAESQEPADEGLS